MSLLSLIVLASAASACPNMEGVWMQGAGERILVMEQSGCRLSATVAEPGNQVLQVRGFWTGTNWTMAATRLGSCATTAWGEIHAASPDAMTIHVNGSDGLCGPEGTAGPGPMQLNATISYRRIEPAR